MGDRSPRQDRPLAIHIAGRSSNIRFGQIDVEGEYDLVKVEDQVSDVSFGGIRHTLVSSRDRGVKRWWGRPIGKFILTVLATVVAAAIVFFAGWN